MRASRNCREPNGRIKRRINHRRRDAINRRRLHDHRSGSAIGRGISRLRTGVIRGGSGPIYNGPAGNGPGGKSVNAARRLRPACRAGSQHTHRCHSQNDRRNRRDFQELLHIHPSHKMFLLGADSMLAHPALFDPHPSNPNTVAIRQSCTPPLQPGGKFTSQRVAPSALRPLPSPNRFPVNPRLQDFLNRSARSIHTFRLGARASSPAVFGVPPNTFPVKPRLQGLLNGSSRNIHTFRFGAREPAHRWQTARRKTLSRKPHHWLKAEEPPK